MTRRSSPRATSDAGIYRNYRRICIVLLGGLTAVAALVTVALLIATQAIGRLELSPNQVTEVYWSMRIHAAIAALGTIGLLVVRRRPTLSRRVARVSVLAFTLAMLISLDRILGICYPPPSELNSLLEPHPTRGWALRRGTVGSQSGVRAEINALGMRGPEIKVRKSDGEFRILFLGDSITFGYFLAYDDTFVAQTGRRIRQIVPDLKITDMNAGVWGYSTWQELDCLESEGLRLDPDLIILEYCFNDVAELTRLDPGMISRRPLRFEFSNKPHWSGLARMALSIYGRHRFNATIASLHFSGNIPAEGSDPHLPGIDDLYDDDPGPEARAAWNRSFGLLDQVNALCRAKGIPWVLMPFPLASQLDVDGPIVRPQKKLTEWADQRGVKCLDLLPAFRRQVTENGRKPWDLFIDDLHPTAEGCRLTADELVRFLTREKLVPNALVEIVEGE